MQLAHNRRVGGVTRAEVLLNLGREDELDLDGLRRLAASITRFTDGDGGGDAAAGRAGRVRGRRRRGRWAGCGCSTGCGARLGRRPRAAPRCSARGGSRTDVERVLFALVANRALDPCSKLAAAEWASRRRRTSRVWRRWTRIRPTGRWTCWSRPTPQAKVQEAVFFACADLLNLEVDLLFFDTTIDLLRARRARAAGDGRRVPRLRALQGPPPRPAADRDRARRHPRGDPGPGLVLAGQHQRHDRASSEVKDDLRGWRLGRVVTVVDRGFSSDENLRYLTRGGRALDRRRADARRPPGRRRRRSSRQGRYQTVRDNLRVKEVRVGDGDAAKRFIICHNPAEADRERSPARRHDRPPARPSSSGSRPQRAKAKSAKAAERAHPRRVRAARPPHARALPAPDPDRAGCVIDRAKIAAEAALDGKFLLSTSDPDLSAEDVALGYKNLLEAERGFRDLKTTLELRPVFHRLEHRIRAHVLICWLALLLIRVAERQTDHTWRRIAPRARAPAPRHPHRPRRHRRADHRAHRRPARASSPPPASQPPPRITALQPA